MAPPLAELARLDDAGFRQRFAGSPVKRIGRDRFVRNVLIAIGNSGTVDLAAVAQGLLSDPSPLVRGAAVWALAAIGVVFKLFSTGRFKLFSTLVYVAMGWLVLLAIKPVWAALDGWTLGWLFAGGAAYRLGTFFYHRRSPGYAHAIWHLFVIDGVACHFIAVAAQVLPRG